MLEVLRCWKFSQYKQFRYTKSLICYNERIKKVYARRFVAFYFYLVVPYSVYFLLEFEATSHKAMLQEDGANVSILSGGVFFRRDDIQFTYNFNE